MQTLNSYKPIALLKGSHLETMLPGLLRSPKKIVPVYEKIPTPDGDFLELDWYHKKSSLLAIISHGLEGNSDRAYMKGMAKIFIDNNYDALCWNYRGCGSSLNIKPKLYHSGATYDLDTVVTHAVSKGYEDIILIGFSLGGNLTLKYAGEQGESQGSKIKAVITFSVPLDLSAGCDQLSVAENWMYSKRFIKKLKKKVKLKHRQFPDKIHLNGLAEIKDLRSFDDRYTGPIHGFKGATDYYEKCSALSYLSHITVPTLIVNAKNDPFLPKECYPYELIDSLANITLETPDHGGHVGFMEINKQGYYWSEKRALSFVVEKIATIG